VRAGARAPRRRALWVIGHSGTLVACPPWRALLEHCAAERCLFAAAPPFARLLDARRSELLAAPLPPADAADDARPRGREARRRAAPRMAGASLPEQVVLPAQQPGAVSRPERSGSGGEGAGRRSSGRRRRRGRSRSRSSSGSPSPSAGRPPPGKRPRRRPPEAPPPHPPPPARPPEQPAPAARAPAGGQGAHAQEEPVHVCAEAAAGVPERAPDAGRAGTVALGPPGARLPAPRARAEPGGDRGERARAGAPPGPAADAPAAPLPARAGPQDAAAPARAPAAPLAVGGGAPSVGPAGGGAGAAAPASAGPAAAESPAAAPAAPLPAHAGAQARGQRDPGPTAAPAAPEAAPAKPRAAAAAPVTAVGGDPYRVALLHCPLGSSATVPGVPRAPDGRKRRKGERARERRRSRSPASGRKRHWSGEEEGANGRDEK